MSEKKKNEENTDVHLKSVRMAGFKNYLHPVELELGKVNFLLGPNGAGKSSFLQAIELMGIFSAPKVLDGLALEDLSRFGTLKHVSKGNVAGEVVLAVAMDGRPESVELEVRLKPRAKGAYQVREWTVSTESSVLKLGRGADSEWYMSRVGKQRLAGLSRSAQSLLDVLATFDGVQVVEGAMDILCYSSFQETFDERKRGYFDTGARWPNPRVIAVSNEFVLCLTKEAHLVLSSRMALSSDAWIETGFDDVVLTIKSMPNVGLGCPETWSQFFNVQSQEENPSSELVSLGLALHAYYMHLSSVDVLPLPTGHVRDTAFPWQMAWMIWAQQADPNGRDALDGWGDSGQLLQGYDEGALSKDVYRDFPLGRRAWQGSKTAQSSLVYWLGHDGPFGLNMSDAMYKAGHGVSNDNTQALYDSLDEKQSALNIPNGLDPVLLAPNESYQLSSIHTLHRRPFRGLSVTHDLQKKVFEEVNWDSSSEDIIEMRMHFGIGDAVQSLGVEIHHVGPDVEGDFKDGGSVFEGDLSNWTTPESELVSCWIPQGSFISTEEANQRAKAGFNTLAVATRRFGWGEVRYEWKDRRRVVMLRDSKETQGKVQDTRTWFQGESMTVADDRGDFTRSSLEDWGKPMKAVPVPMKLQGRGVRQVVAVVLHLIRIACDGKSGAKVVALEEPTAFLHPRLASEFTGLIRELADVLGLTIIIETHNEYMIRQLSTDRLNGDTLEDVRIHYVGAQGDDYVLPIRVDHDGVFTPAIPEGFLDKSSAMQREQRQLKKKRGA